MVIAIENVFESRKYSFCRLDCDEPVHVICEDWSETNSAEREELRVSFSVLFSELGFDCVVDFGEICGSLLGMYGQH